MNFDLNDDYLEVESGFIMGVGVACWVLSVEWWRLGECWLVSYISHYKKKHNNECSPSRIVFIHNFIVFVNHSNHYPTESLHEKCYKAKLDHTTTLYGIVVFKIKSGS